MARYHRVSHPSAMQDQFVKVDGNQVSQCIPGPNPELNWERVAPANVSGPVVFVGSDDQFRQLLRRQDLAMQEDISRHAM